MERRYYVYILASRSRSLYTGITNNLMRRVSEHREDRVPGFTRNYRIHRLVYFESFHGARTAITREKQIKSWRRSKKVALIEARNPMWDDLAVGWAAAPDRKKQIPRPDGIGARDDKQERQQH